MKGYDTTVSQTSGRWEPCPEAQKGFTRHILYALELIHLLQLTLFVMGLMRTIKVIILRLNRIFQGLDNPNRIN